MADSATARHDIDVKLTHRCRTLTKGRQRRQTTAATPDDSACAPKTARDPSAAVGMTEGASAESKYIPSETVEQSVLVFVDAAFQIVRAHP